MLVATGVVSSLLAVGSGFAIERIGYYDSQLVKVQTGEDAGPGGLKDVHVTPACLKKVCNYLIVGSDARKVVEGQRADTIIIVHTDPKQEGAIVLSIPRDLRVRIPGRGMGKINNAFSFGRNTMVRAIERLTKLDINHYVQVNFAGFRGIVDALGGVEICVPRRMVDRKAHLRLPRKGCYNLKGKEALAFVRARSVEGDRIPDFARIGRQQQFMSVLIHELLSPRRVLHVDALMKAVRRNLVVDENLNLYELQDLTRTLSEASKRNVRFRVVPAVPKMIGNVSYVVPIEPATSKLFYRIRTNRPLGRLGKAQRFTPMSPANITVRVIDTGSGGKAEEVSRYLAKAGFLTLGVQPPPADLAQAQRARLLYGQGFGEQARVVSSYLPGVPKHLDRTHTGGADVTVVVGPLFDVPRS